MRQGIFVKTLLLCLVLVITALVTASLLVRKSWRASLREQAEKELALESQAFAARVASDHEHAPREIAAQEAQATGMRATIVDSAGALLADSQPGAADAPGQSPEVAAALHGRADMEARDNAAGELSLYASAPTPGGAVRLACSLEPTAALDARLQSSIAFSLGIALLLSLLLAAAAAHFTSRRLDRIVAFAESLAAGDLGARISESSLDEIGKVSSALDRTADRIQVSFAAADSGQHRLETLLNSMQDGVIAVNSEGRIEWANAGMDRLLSQKTRLQSPLVETVRDPAFLAVVADAVESRRVHNARAASIIPGRTFDVTAAPLPGGGAVAVLRDLTETERVEKTRRDFIANVSHELRTPLTSIQGYAETLLDGDQQNGHVREFLEIIRKNASRMSRLTEDLLTLARVESGETRFELETVAPAELVQDAIESFVEIARSHNVSLQVAETAQTPVQADREAIHQVFANLIDNALKYGASGGEIVLGARPVNRGVEFYVADRGPGIPSEHLPRLFERFYRVDKARSRESGGTGLGLAIAKHIVLAHGGTIRAESELFHGSTFLFTLPLAPPAHG
jgi:two-component system phosphate regulon sensor histidine kinase PhoR